MNHPALPFDARQVDPRVRLAMRILEFEQIRVPSVNHVAVRVGLSPFRLAHLFAAQTGESCAGYARRIRLDNSVNQLMHDPVPVNVVAASFGYASQAAYTRAFTRQFGLSPLRFLMTVMGRTQADYQASHLDAIAPPGAAGELPAGQVSLVERPSRPALARRFYGPDLADHWRRFLAELPAGLSSGASLAGLAYDNVRVTRADRWRYDCALVFADRHDPAAIGGRWGLDRVEVPGGLHAEAAVDGALEDLWRATIGLLTEWLPANPRFRPEGDPLVHWFAAPPTASGVSAVTTIRIRQRDQEPAYNARPLTPHGRPAGQRTPLPSG